MNWFNLRISLLHAPEYVGCEPVARATWLNLSIYCCEQENGGRIRNCREWKCRQWQQTAGVTLAEINASGPLVEWDGDDIILWNYPIEREEEVRLLRESGRKGGQSKSERKIEAARLNGTKRKPSQSQATLGLEPKQEPKGNPSQTQGVTQRKGSTKEGEVQGEEERKENTPEEPSASLSKSEETRHHKFIRLWSERFKAHFGMDYPFTGGRDGKAVAALVKNESEPIEEIIKTAELAWTIPGFVGQNAAVIHSFHDQRAKIIQALRHQNPNGNRTPAHRTERLQREFCEPPVKIPILNSTDLRNTGGG